MAEIITNVRNIVIGGREKRYLKLKTDNGVKTIRNIYIVHVFVANGDKSLYVGLFRKGEILTGGCDIELQVNEVNGRKKAYLTILHS